MKQAVILFLLVLIYQSLLAQYPNTPQASGFQPVLPQRQSSYTPPMPDANGQIQLGGTAESVIRQTYESRGLQYRTGTNDPASNQRANTERIMAEMANNPAYNPNLRNPLVFNPKMSGNAEIQKLLLEEGLKENHAQSLQMLSGNYYSSPDFAQKTQSYAEALQLLGNMLSGKLPLSISDAYYSVEYAYGNVYLNKSAFKSTIAESARFIRQWMQQNKLSLQNPEDVHLAIQRFMSTPLSIGNTSGKEDNKQFRLGTHTPFFYDFNDYDGEKDYRNYFLTKCLATGSGQCSSLPAVYLCLAEALGVTAYLSLAPQHAFIKYVDNQGHIVNYEPTSNWKMSDRWYQDNMFITPEAKRNGIYLDTLNKREIIADCLLSLSFGYMQKFGAADARFVSQCLELAEPAFSRPRVQALFIRSCLLARMLSTVMYASGISQKEDLPKSKEALAFYNNLEANEALIKKLGYRDQPKELYNELLKTHEFRGRQQDSLQIDGKQKRNLFHYTN